MTRMLPIAGIGSGVAPEPATCAMDVLWAAMDPANCRAMTIRRMEMPIIMPMADSVSINLGMSCRLMLKTGETTGQTMAVNARATRRRMRIGMLCSPNPGSRAVTEPTRISTRNALTMAGSLKSNIWARASNI